MCGYGNICLEKEVFWAYVNGLLDVLEENGQNCPVIYRTTTFTPVLRAPSANCTT